MKKTLRILAAFFSLAALNIEISTTYAQGTAFTYQGQLQTSGSPAHGLYDFVFSLSNAPSGGSQIGNSVTNTGVAVTNGLFTTTIDFGSVFTGNAAWLAISVRTNGVGSYLGLNPLQQLTPTPYAIFAETANAAHVTSIGNTNSQIGGNYFVGPSGNATESGSDNTGIGVDTLQNNTNGTGNTADGANALAANTSGQDNTATGLQALFENTSGGQNTADGAGALYWNGIISDNTAAGSDNTAVGYGALANNFSGNDNTAIGASALASLGMGYFESANVTGGTNNIALGDNAGSGFNGNESSNIDIGNPGQQGENNTIRIGSSQSQTYIAGTINGNGAGLTNLNASQFTSGTVPYSALPGFQSSGNYSAVDGGQGNAMGGQWAVIGGGYQNTNSGEYATIGGGSENTANGKYATVGGGTGNTANSAYYETIGGGENNTASGAYATVSGGTGNTASGEAATAAGYGNQASNNGATVAGGGNNIASGFNSDIGGGANNYATQQGAVVGGGYYNTNSGTCATIPGGYLNIASGNYATVSGNLNAALNSGATVAGGGQNTASGINSFIGGGSYNTATNQGAVISGGYSNTNNGEYTTIGGGITNLASGYCTTISGGSINTAYAPYASIAGGFNNNIPSGGNYSCIGGGYLNTNSAQAATVTGGYENTASANFATVSGYKNTASGTYTIVGGGVLNTASSLAATVGGGEINMANANYATIGGGLYNTNTGASATIPGGYLNLATGTYSFAAGQEAQAVNQGAFVWADSQNAPFASTGNDQFLIRAQGGVGINTANPQQDLTVKDGMDVDAAGNDTGSVNGAWTFLFGGATGEGIGSVRVGGHTDSYSLDFYTNYGRRMTILQSGYIGIGTTNPANLFVVGGSASPAYCNGTTWENGSDRNSKKDFSPISPREVLEKVSALPITEWQYKVEAKGMRHMGPMAQDFHAAFGLNGTDDKHVATVDEEGVALAAIQGLNQKLDDKDKEIQQLQQSVAELKAMVAQLAQARTK